MRPLLEIFVVEDHEDTMSVLCGLLRDWGYSVRCATNFATAQAALSLRTCDVLLSDIKLPDGDGWQLLRSLGVNAPGYRIAMSGFGTAADQARSLSAGFRKHLVKPFEADTLLGLLRDVELERLRSERAGPDSSAPLTRQP